MKINKFEIFVNLIFWILSGWLIISSFSIETHQVEMIKGVETVTIERSGHIIVQLFIVIILSAILFYSNFWNILRIKKINKILKISLLSIIFLISTWGLYQIIESLFLYPEYPRLPLGTGIGTIIFYYAISVTYSIVKLWQHSESQRRRISFEKKQAQLNLLRSQLHPHFLFNTLNNLLSMVDQQKSPVLADALDRLSGLLRYVVYEISAGKVVLKKELEFIRNYAALQQLRFERNEVKFNFQVRGKYDQQMIEPGLFIPFIENAFKYGTEPEKDSIIEVSFDLTKESEIIFIVSNPIYLNKQNNDNSTGISSTKERLRLVYPDRHQLKIIKSDKYIVELKIKTDESHNR